MSDETTTAAAEEPQGAACSAAEALRRAKAELEKAQSLAPDDPVIAEHLGDAYAKSNLSDKALRMYELSLKLDPKKTEVKEKIKKLQDKKKRR